MVYKNDPGQDRTYSSQREAILDGFRPDYQNPGDDIPSHRLEPTNPLELLFDDE
jgi:hypothetical protein